MWRLLVVALIALAVAESNAVAFDEPSVSTAQGDLIVHTYPANARPKGTLVVLIHGDVSDGGPADYLSPLAEKLGGASPDTVAVALIRPGYTDSAGRRSAGEAFGRRDHYRLPAVAAIAEAITRLKDQHQARRVVALGHSGGAAMVALVLALRPGAIDRAVLVSCPCDVPRWRAGRSGAWPNSLSPQDYADKVPTAVRLWALTGRDDDNTPPALAADYVAALTARGIGAWFVTVAGARHGFASIAAKDAFHSALAAALAAD